jgi:hypothetical protein
MVNNITIGSLHRFLKIESKNQTKPHQFLIDLVRF